jgi:polyhydroxyalkanoate synthesis regulator phasin
MNFSELSRPLDISDIDFRVQSINNGGYATILAYKDARVDMARLDSAVGPLGWQRKHELISGNLYCHVGVYNDDIHEWVWKSDVGTESMTEATKGQSSDSFKRACFNWGIGRELYDYPFISVKLNENEWDNKSGKPRQTYNLKIKDWRWYSEFTDGRLSFLAAKDENGKLRFKWGEMKPKEVEPDYKQAASTQEVDPTPEPVAEVKPVTEEGDVKGFLKKEVTPLEEVDGSAEERQHAIEQYKAVFGKAPHGRMATDTILNAVQEEIMRLNKEEQAKNFVDKVGDEIVKQSQEEVEELDDKLHEEIQNKMERVQEEANVPEIELTIEPEQEILASIKDMYSTIEMFKEPSTFIPWAKDIVAAFINTESAENIKEFQDLCNAHYARIKNNK